MLRRLLPSGIGVGIGVGVGGGSLHAFEHQGAGATKGGRAGVEIVHDETCRPAVA